MASAILASIFHPSEVVALVQYKLTPKSKYNYSNNKTRERLYYFLNLTSRSFAAVIQSLDEELKDAVSVANVGVTLRDPSRTRLLPGLLATSL
jgi:farnesyl-diphosphate farnesyltransferase